MNKALFSSGLFLLCKISLVAQGQLDSLVKITNIETSYPSWSPDGKKLVFQSNRNDDNSEIYISNIEGKALKRLTYTKGKDEYPVFAPDGKTIAFSSYKEGYQDILIMDVDGKNKRNLTRHSANDIHPQYSPDGKTLIFNSNRNGNYDLFLFDIESSEIEAITNSPYPDTYAHWSPDGRKLVFVRWMPVAEGKLSGDIFVLDLATKEEIRLTSKPSFDGWPTWSAKGDFILFASNRHNGADFQIYKMGPTGADITKITEGERENSSFTKPVVDRNTGNIVCTRTKEGNVEIFVLALQDQ